MHKVGPAPSFCADCPSGVQLDSWQMGVQISQGIGRRVERGQGRRVLWCQTEIQFLHGTFRFGVTWDGRGDVGVARILKRQFLSHYVPGLGDSAAGSGPACLYFNHCFQSRFHFFLFIQLYPAFTFNK